MSGIFGTCKSSFAEREARMTEQNQKTGQHHVGSSRIIASDRHAGTISHSSEISDAERPT